MCEEVVVLLTLSGGLGGSGGTLFSSSSAKSSPTASSFNFLLIGFVFGSAFPPISITHLGGSSSESLSLSELDDSDIIFVESPKIKLNHDSDGYQELHMYH